MKKQLTLLLVASMAAAPLAALMTSGAFDKVFAGDVCADGHHGYHYVANAATYDAPGNLEFWACCTCNQQFLTQPAGTFTERSFDEHTGDFDINHIAYIPMLQNFEIAQVRDNYTVTVDDTEELLYTKDATQHTIGDSTFRGLWDDGKVYLFVTPGENTTSITLTFGSEDPVTFTSAKEFSFDVTGLAENSEVELSFDVTASERTLTYGGKVTAVLNSNNNAEHARKLFTAKHTDTVPTIDGVRDAVYETSSVIMADVEVQGNTFDTATTYMLWDDDNLYVHMTIYDVNIIDNVALWRQWATDYDSVEFYLSTCQDLPTSSTKWGETASYLGGLSLYRRPGDPGDTFFSDGLMKDGGISHASLSPNHHDGFDAPAENTYTIEYKIPWVDTTADASTTSFFDVENKENQIIDFSITVNDGFNNSKDYFHGKRCTNYGNQNINRGDPANLQYMDQLQLIA